jgi:hypothetical protein
MHIKAEAGQLEVNAQYKNTTARLNKLKQDIKN